MPKILNYNEFCKDLKEVTSSKIFSKKKFHPEGLFSEQIFGPLKNYTCQCGVYYGVSKSGGTCEICGVDIVNSNVRRTRFAKITLPIPVVNPLFYDILVDLGGKSLKDVLDQLMRNEKSFLYIDGEDCVASTNSEIAKKHTIFEKTDAIYKLVETISNMLAQEGMLEWKIVNNSLDDLLLHNVIVLPPDLRPSSAMSRNKQLMDEINRYYVQILTKKEIMKDTILNIMNDKSLFYTYYKQLQSVVNELYHRILEKLSKKEGLIRGNILGKRIDFSGRAVITPDPTLEIDECVLPYVMVLEIYKLPIAKKLIETGKFKLLNKAVDFVDKCIEFNSPVLYQVAEEVTKDEVCLLNRQPSLHRLSLLGFRIKLSMDKVIKIPPLVCQPFNADFDGDQMAAYIPISEGARDEIRNKMLVTENFSSPSNESLTTVPNQDVILGIYALTESEEGRKLFNSCLPEGYPKVDKQINKKDLFEILSDIKDNYPNNLTAKVLDDIKRIGFKEATLRGFTLSLDKFEIASAKNIKESLYESNDIRNQLQKVTSQEVNKILKENFNYAYMIDSGARGSWDQAKQMALTRGFISNFNGEILPNPIKHSLVEGLTEEEFFYSTYGCRKGLLDVALNTGTSGYLSRKLIFTCANLQISKDLVDCGTKDLLEVYVKNKRKAKMLVNRYYLDEGTLKKITRENCYQLVGKVIHIRSPILCTSEQVCHICYGDLIKSLRTKFIGVVAAQTLGERGTQLVLRTFHTSGSARIKGETTEMHQKDIIGDLTTVSHLLHNFKTKTYVSIVDELFDAYDTDIYQVHFECVVAQLMWLGLRKWRLHPERSKHQPTYHSVQSVPNKESWILAMAFSNPKKAILQGILNEGHYSGIIDKILTGKKIN